MLDGRWQYSGNDRDLHYRGQIFAELRLQFLDLVFQDDYQSALKSIAGVLRVVLAVLEFVRVRSGTPREAMAGYDQDRRLGSPGTFCEGLHDDGVPDIRLLHDGARGCTPLPGGSASHFERQRIFTWAHRLAVRLRVEAKCCCSFAQSLGVPYQSGRWWYRCPLLGGKLKVGLPGVSCISFFDGSLGVGFLLVLVGVSMAINPGSTPPFGKGRKFHPSMGLGQKMDGRNRTSAARQRRGFRRHLCPKTLSSFHDRHKPRPSTPKLVQLSCELLTR